MYFNSTLVARRVAIPETVWYTNGVPTGTVNVNTTRIISYVKSSYRRRGKL